MTMTTLTRRQVLRDAGVLMSGIAIGRSVAAAAGHATPASQAGTLVIGKDLTVNRLGFGAMRLVGADVWGEPLDRAAAKAVLRRAVELGVNFIDTADAYGPATDEVLIAEALLPVSQGPGDRDQGRHRAPVARALGP